MTKDLHIFNCKGQLPVLLLNSFILWHIGHSLLCKSFHLPNHQPPLDFLFTHWTLPFYSLLLFLFSIFKCQASSKPLNAKEVFSAFQPSSLKSHGFKHHMLIISGLGRSAREGIGYPFQYSWASLVVQLVKNPPAMWETWVWPLGWEDPLEKGKTTHSSILAWRIPWTV